MSNRTPILKRAKRAPTSLHFDPAAVSSSHLDAPVESDSDSDSMDLESLDLAPSSQLSPPTHVAEDLPISPSKDLKSYRELIKRMAATLHLRIPQLAPEINSSIYDIIQKDASTAVALTVTK